MTTGTESARLPEGARQATVLLAGDHAAVGLKGFLVAALRQQSYVVVDLGASGDESVDYPDYARRIADGLAAGEGDRGILLCGTGIGIGMAANRFRHVRAAVSHDVTTARLAREHNDANVLAMGARIVGEEVAKDAAETFLATAFAGGRHQRRVAKLANPAEAAPVS